SAVAGALARSLPFGSPALKTTGDTSLGKELPFELIFADGVAHFQKPLQISQERGSLSVEGGIALEGKLDLNGVLALSPQAIHEITRGKVKTTAPIPIAYRLTGPVSSPQVTTGDLGPTLQALLGQALSQGLGTGGGPQLENMKKKLKSWLGQ